ncbi:Hint domain-containing protein [Aliiroseovarius sp. S1339]|uniref:Hint domain-containing protein n=1 Tax=Aliiroseovarius sp. S1339 TaxID=2936990 RepID=UPI0020C15B19|nr:Hint domain-containing protein [Aliiroseovarius sp. S1339]MCK8465414.1 Hint domain-containing protein [Aliiroseovarius sp. S1339]
METGFNGTFVISWAQTEVDGLPGAPVTSLGVGSNWRWTGSPLRVDGPRELRDLESASGEQDLRRRAAHSVHKLVGAAIDPSRPLGSHSVDSQQLNMGFEVTDGHASYVVTLIDGVDDQILLMFLGEMPPANTDFWVVRASMTPCAQNRLLEQPSGVICFAPGTRLRTHSGEVCVEELREGDELQTRDNGTQKVLWIGNKRITGARMFAMPALRPIRLRAGAIRSGQPDADLVVSGQHQILLNGKRARELFNEDEVLISARDLVDERRVVVDYTIREIVYHHVLLENHEVVWANGVPAESFHPANADLDSLDPGQRDRLVEMFPQLDFDPMAYGHFARRSLNRGEAAILRGKTA